MIDAALLFPKLLERAGDNPELAEAAAITAWKRIAGEGLEHHATPMSLRDGRLIVAVADDVWKKQLERMSKDLTFRINKLLRREVVTTIQFRVNARALKTRPDNAAASRKHVRPPTDVIASAAEIEDVDLRERFIRAATNCIDHREERARRAGQQSAIRNSQSEI
jgi:hypothetical protein